MLYLQNAYNLNMLKSRVLNTVKEMDIQHQTELRVTTVMTCSGVTNVAEKLYVLFDYNGGVTDVIDPTYMDDLQEFYDIISEELNTKEAGLKVRGDLNLYLGFDEHDGDLCIFAQLPPYFWENEEDAEERKNAEAGTVNFEKRYFQLLDMLEGELDRDELCVLMHRLRDSEACEVYTFNDVLKRLELDKNIPLLQTNANIKEGTSKTLPKTCKKHVKCAHIVYNNIDQEYAIYSNGDIYRASDVFYVGNVFTNHTDNRMDRQFFELALVKWLEVWK